MQQSNYEIKDKSTYDLISMNTKEMTSEEKSTLMSKIPDSIGQSTILSKQKSPKSDNNSEIHAFLKSRKLQTVYSKSKMQNSAEAANKRPNLYTKQSFKRIVKNIIWHFRFQR